MNRLSRVALCLAIGGCGARSALDEVSVLGGSETQRALALAELQDFDQWVGPGRLGLHQVSFEPMAEGLLGRYRGLSNRILLSDDLLDDRVREVLRHELCHALDDAEDLMTGDHPMFDRLAGAMNGVRQHGSGPRELRSEALATACEAGPMAASLLRTPCDGDAEEVSDPMGWLAHEIWAGFQVPAENGGVAPAQVSVVFSPRDNPWSGMTAAATEDPDLIELSVTAEGGRSFQTRHLDSGEAVTVPGPTVPNHDPNREVPTGLPIGGTPVATAGWAEGPGAALVAYYVRDVTFPSVEERLLWTAEAGGWGEVVGACDVEGQQADVFATRGLAWLAWGDGEVISWSALGNDTNRR